MQKIYLSLLLLLIRCDASETDSIVPIKSDEYKVVAQDEVIEDDYFASGGNIEIAGTINGDLYAIGSQIFIDGTVNGDVLVLGGSVTITGDVLGSARIIAGQTKVTGRIARSLTALSGNCELSQPSRVGGNVTIVAGNSDISGAIGGSCRFYGSNLRLADSIARDAYVYAGGLRLTSMVSIGGALEYWSDSKAMIDPGARAEQGIIHHPSFFYNLSHHPFLKWFKFGSRLATLLMNFFYCLVIGLLFMRYYPLKLKRSLEAMSHRPWQSLLTGIVLLVLLPLVSLLLLMTILGVPFALTLIAINVVGFYTAKVFSILWISQKTFRHIKYARFSRWYYFLMLIVYFLLTSIPYLGPLIATAAMLFGLGAIALSRAEEERPLIEGK